MDVIDVINPIIFFELCCFIIYYIILHLHTYVHTDDTHTGYVNLDKSEEVENTYKSTFN